MEFREAMSIMENRGKVKRPAYKGYIFLDVDNRVKHAGEMVKNEEFWQEDFLLNDWEEYKSNGDDEMEITEARLEALMDASSSHIKKLYYLEDIIEGKHKAFKKIAEETTGEMGETRKAISTSVKQTPYILKTLQQLSEILADNTMAVLDIKKGNKILTDEIKKVSEKLNMIHGKFVSINKENKMSPKTDRKNATEEEEKQEMAEVKQKVTKILDKKRMSVKKDG